MTGFLSEPSASLALALMLVLAGTSGCLGGEDPAEEGAEREDSGTTEGPAARLPSGWALGECNGYSVQTWVPSNATRDSLPQGFEPATDDPAGQAQRLFVDVYHCREVTLEDQALGEGRVLTAKIEVQPPEDLRRSEEASHFLYLAVLAERPALVEAMQAAGLPAREATPVLETVGGEARVGTGEASHGDVSAQLRVATGNLTANELEIGAEESRVFGLDRPLGAEGTPRVTSVVDRDLSPTNITMGEGNWTLAGSILPESLPPSDGGLGFDTQERTYGETFRLRALGETGPTGGTEPSSPTPLLVRP